MLINIKYFDYDINLTAKMLASFKGIDIFKMMEKFLLTNGVVSSSAVFVSDLMIEMEDHTNDLSEARIPFLDYKTYTDANFFLPSKDGANDAMITRKLQIPEARRAIVAQALNQFSNLLNSKTFLINVRPELFDSSFKSIES